MPTEIASKADVSYQEELWLGRSSGGVWTYTQIFGVETVAMPERTPEETDVTHQQSPGRTRETIPGLMAAADYAQEMQLWAGDVGQGYLDTLSALTEAGNPEDVRVIMIVGGIQRTYRAHVMSFTPTGTVGDKRMANAAFRIFERVIPNPAVGSIDVAPVNTVPPYIQGSPIVGQILTAWEGLWEGATSFTYQWKAAGTNISGATAKTYTLTSGEDGDVITVTVTATNATGSASATSAATEEVE